MPNWTLRFGPSPAGLAWVVERENGTGSSAVFEPDAYEKARHILVRRALVDVAAVLTVSVEEGAPRIVREVLGR